MLYVGVAKPVRTKLIAAGLMLTMASWVESLALPVVMSAPPAFPASGLTGLAHAPMHEHSCCHEHGQPPIPQVPTQAPRGNQHRCCFLRAPQASPVSTQKSEKPPSANASPNAHAEPAQTALPHLTQHSPTGALAILSRMSVVLRN